MCADRAPPLFAATEITIVPLAVPLVLDESQGASVAAVHAQPVSTVT
jgi:hypothetical protein